jgi:hypothetical protein
MSGPVSADKLRVPRYVLFDLLFHAGRCLMRVPLIGRRELAEVCKQPDAVIVFSPAVIDPLDSSCWNQPS